MAKSKAEKTTGGAGGGPSKPNKDGGLSSHVGSIIRFPELVEAVQAQREPSDQALRFIALALQHPEARDKGVVALLTQVDAWLRSNVSGQECRKQFVQTGMPQALAGLLQRLGVWREEIAEDACAVVGSAAFQSKEIANAFVQASVLEIICDCMMRHIESSGVQQSGVGAICALAQHGLIQSSQEEAKAQLKLVGSGVAVQSLLRAMAAYPQLQDLQFFGCEGLRHLVSNGEPYDHALQNKFVDASRRAAEAHPKARAVIKASRALLEALQTPEQKRCMLLGVEALVSLHDNPPQSTWKTDKNFHLNFQ